MEIKKDSIKKFVQNGRFSRTATITALCILFFGFVIWFGLLIFELYSDFNVQNKLTAQLTEEVRVLQDNKQLLADVEDFNETLSQLIPDTESYFQVISALEQLEETTGIVIDTYSINLEQTTQEKLSLDVSIDADVNSFEAFLQKYHFGSGRLLVNDAISFKPNELSSTNVTLHFYHKAFNFESISQTDETSDLLNRKEEIEKIRELLQTN